MSDFNKSKKSLCLIKNHLKKKINQKKQRVNMGWKSYLKRKKVKVNAKLLKRRLELLHLRRSQITRLKSIRDHRRRRKYRLLTQNQRKSTMDSNTTPNLVLTLQIKTHMNVQKVNWKEIKPVTRILPLTIRRSFPKEMSAS